MRWFHTLLHGLRALFHKKQVEQEMEEELRGYLDAAVKEKRRSGLSREQALRAARVEMGSGALRLEWQAPPGRQSWQRARERAYRLRTNLSPGEPAQFWKSYIQLTEAEAAFRALKSRLSMRSIFHQLGRRAKAHILVVFLGYSLWVTLKHLLVRKGSAP
jgi:hypothetical protein